MSEHATTRKSISVTEKIYPIASARVSGKFCARCWPQRPALVEREQGCDALPRLGPRISIRCKNRNKLHRHPQARSNGNHSAHSSLKPHLQVGRSTPLRETPALAILIILVCDTRLQPEAGERPVRGSTGALVLAPAAEAVPWDVALARFDVGIFAAFNAVEID